MTGILQPPWGFLSFLKASYAGVPTGGDFAATAGAVGIAYTYLNEVDPSGNIVTPMSLTSRTWSSSGVLTYGSELSSINYTTTIGTTQIRFVVIASNVLGKLNFADAPVSPKTLETVIEITHTYQNPLNHLELGIGVTTVDADMRGNAIITKKGDSNVYLTMAAHAIVNGTVGDADVAAYAAGTIEGSLIDIWFNALIGTKRDTYVTSVSFPAGATTILYDPAVGQGEKILFGAAPKGVLPSLILLVAVLCLLL